MLAQRKIISGNLGGDDQADIFEIGGARLIVGLRGFNAPAATAEKIDFVADGEGQRVTIL